LNINKIYIQQAGFNGLIFNTRLFLSHLTRKHAEFTFNQKDIVNTFYVNQNNENILCFLIRKQEYDDNQLQITYILVDLNGMELVNEINKRRYSIEYTELVLLKYTHLMYGNFQCYVYYIKGTREFLFSRYSMDKIRETYKMCNLDTIELDNLVCVEHLDGTGKKTSFDKLGKEQLIYPDKQKVSVYLKPYEYIKLLLTDLQDKDKRTYYIELMDEKNPKMKQIIDLVTNEPDIGKLEAELAKLYEEERRTHNNIVKTKNDELIANIATVYNLSQLIAAPIAAPIAAQIAAPIVAPVKDNIPPDLMVAPIKDDSILKNKSSNTMNGLNKLLNNNTQNIMAEFNRTATATASAGG